MAQQLDNEGFSTGSNYKFADKMIRPNFPRSMFDLSHLVTRDISEAGLVFPISVIEALPASDYEITVNSLVRVMPQVVPLMSKQRLYLYAFYSRCTDLWSNFDVFIRKGYSGNEVKTVPVISTVNNCLTYSNAVQNFDNVAGSSTYPISLNSLGDFFGLPLGSISALPEYFNINAMPFMMYTRIWRDYFLNRNFYVDDRNILPDDDSRFRLNDNGIIMSFLDNNSSYLPVFDLKGFVSSHIDTSSSPYSRIPSRGMQYGSKNAFVIGPFYHDYPADYFTSALPWPQRGNTPTLDLTPTSSVALSMDPLSLSSSDYQTLLSSIADISSSGAVDGNGAAFNAVGLTYDDVSGSFNFGIGRAVYGLYTGGSSNFWSANVQNPTSWSASAGASGYANTQFNTWLANSLAKVTPTGSGSVSFSGLSITLEDLRELAVSQTIMEKMARTDGSYREFGITFFGEPSKSAMDYRPTFIGGTVQNMIFTEVLQTSQTTDDSMLGQYAGHGISQNTNGYLGRFHADDYGYIMILGCIMPDVYYSQGLEKMWTRTNQSDWFLPERAQLGMQPILNKELYLQSHTVVDTDGNSVNNNLWAYQDIFDELRYRPNRVGGQMADSSANSFYPFTQSRKFTSLPNWSQEFARADDVRTDYLASGIESAYICQFDCNIRAVQPLPYRARPASILNGVS